MHKSCWHLWTKATFALHIKEHTHVHVHEWLWNLYMNWSLCILHMRAFALNIITTLAEITVVNEQDVAIALYIHVWIVHCAYAQLAQWVNVLSTKKNTKCFSLISSQQCTFCSWVCPYMRNSYSTHWMCLLVLCMYVLERSYKNYALGLYTMRKCTL